MAALTVPIPHVRALWRPEQFNRVTNPGFETDTSGWVVTAGINAAATSITRVTGDSHEGSACAAMATTNTDTSGCNFDLGADPHFAEATYGTTYAAVVWLRWTSGSHRVRITLGSLGTAADRSTLLIPDLPSSWTPYRVLWMPTATRTDAELAITNAAAEYVTVRIDAVSIYQVDAFSQVENSNFTVDTAGWSVAAGINAAATSLTRITSDGYAADSGYCATLVTTATTGSGCNYDLGLRKFTSGRTYRARVALKSVSGTTSARLIFGSAASARATENFTVTTSWAWYLVDWTANADRTDVELAVCTGAASVMTCLVAAAEVYEAIDEISGTAVNGTGVDVRADVSHMDWTRGLGSTPGTLNLVLHDPRDARRYTPWNTSGALYGLLEPGRRVWARAIYTVVLRPVAFGTIRRIIPDATTGKVQVMCEDPVYDIGRGSTTRGFSATTTYAGARASLFGASAAAPVGGDRRILACGTNTEAGTFYDGTNGTTGALDYLEQLNEATGTEHWIAPSALSEMLWRYATIGRSDLANAAVSAETIDDDFAALTGTDLTDETLENTQSVPWQAYEELPMPSAASPIVAVAYDPADAAAGEDDPYLHFTDDRWGADEGIPEPAYERHWRWTVRWIPAHGHRGHRNLGHRNRHARKKIRVRTYGSRRIYPNAFVPFTVATGIPKTVTVDFALPMASLRSDYEDTVTSPRQLTSIIRAAATYTSYKVYGEPWLPLDEQVATGTSHDGVLEAGVRAGPAFNTPYVGSPGLAEGLADYRNWRYAAARMTPVLTVQHRFPSMLQRNPGDHLTVNAALFGFTGLVFAITRLSGSCDTGARLWSMDYSLEELPASIGTLFTLGTSALGGAHVLAY